MMTMSIKRLLLTALVAVTPVFTACERADDISSVPVDASFAFNGNSHANTNGNAFGIDKKSNQREALRTTSATTGTVQAWVSGGQDHTLTLAGGYSLYIPKGASKGLTFYQMTLVPLTDADGNTYQLVRLKAWDNHSNAVTTFRNPLRLTVPFSNADPTQLTDESKLRIGYVADGTTSILEVIQVSIDSANQTMTGLITHFSDYTPILD